MASKEELLELRKKTLERIERMKREGDFAAGQADNRANTEALLILIEDRLERR